MQMRSVLLITLQVLDKLRLRKMFGTACAARWKSRIALARPRWLRCGYLPIRIGVYATASRSSPARPVTPHVVSHALWAMVRAFTAGRFEKSREAAPAEPASCSQRCLVNSCKRDGRLISAAPASSPHCFRSTAWRRARAARRLVPGILQNVLGGVAAPRDACGATYDQIRSPCRMACESEARRLSRSRPALRGRVQCVHVSFVYVGEHHVNSVRPLPHLLAPTSLAGL